MGPHHAGKANLSVHDLLLGRWLLVPTDSTLHSWTNFEIQLFSCNPAAQNPRVVSTDRLQMGAHACASGARCSPESGLGLILAPVPLAPKKLFRPGALAPLPLTHRHHTHCTLSTPDPKLRELPLNYSPSSNLTSSMISPWPPSLSPSECPIHVENRPICLLTAHRLWSLT